MCVLRVHLSRVLKLLGRKMGPEDTPKDALEYFLDEFEALRSVVRMHSWEEARAPLTVTSRHPSPRPLLFAAEALDV